MEKEELSKLTAEEVSFLKQYEKEMEQIEPITMKELANLYEHASKKDETAIAVLAEKRLPRVVELAMEYVGKGAHLGDLIQEGNLGLLISLTKLDEKPSDQSYDEFLENKIEDCMLTFLEEEGMEKESEGRIAEQLNGITEAMEMLVEEYGDDFTLDKLSEYTKLSIEEIRELLKLAGENLDVEEKEKGDD